MPCSAKHKRRHKAGDSTHAPVPLFSTLALLCRRQPKLLSDINLWHADNQVQVSIYTVTASEQTRTWPRNLSLPLQNGTIHHNVRRIAEEIPLAIGCLRVRTSGEAFRRECHFLSPAELSFNCSDGRDNGSLEMRR